MDLLVLSLALAASAGPPARPEPTPVCLDLPGAPRRHLQRGPDGALWLELWTRGPEPRGDLVRVDPATGAESHVLADILAAHVLPADLVAVRPQDDDRSVLHGRRALVRAALDGSDERPLTPPDHVVSRYALTRDAALYTTPDDALHRILLLGDRPEHLADGIAAVHAAWPDGSALVTLAGTSELTVRTPTGALRPLDLAGDVVTTPEHVLVDSPAGAWSVRDGAAARLPAGLRPLPGGAFVHPALTVTGAPVVEAVPVPGAIWSLVRHDTDGDGALSPLADEADLCLLGHGARTSLPARDRPRRLTRPLTDFAALAAGDLSGGTFSLDAGALVLRAPGRGPTTLAALHARAAAVHAAAAAIAGGPDLDLRLEWAGNHRHAAVSWDSRLARPALVAGGHGLALPSTVALEHRLDRELDPAALADLDDYLLALDRAIALGFAPIPGRSHAPPLLAAPPDFADLPARERSARAAALWEILAAHADRHHHGRLAPVHLVGTAHTIRRGRLE